MPDLGELEILERPLIIHEAKAGGRKLTKSLFRQLPDWQDIKEQLILPDSPADVVAWVEYHWQDCDDAKYIFYASGDHRHILLSDSGAPYRGTVWYGPRTKGIFRLSLGDITGSGPVGRNMAALLARQRLKGKIFRGSGEITVTHKEQHIRFHKKHLAQGSAHKPAPAELTEGSDEVSLFKAQPRENRFGLVLPVAYIGGFQLRFEPAEH